jgi:hypothetical protein
MLAIALTLLLTGDKPVSHVSFFPNGIAVTSGIGTERKKLCVIVDGDNSAGVYYSPREKDWMAVAAGVDANERLFFYFMDTRGGIWGIDPNRK